MKKILVIGNSYGVDATRYLYGIARAAGKELKVVTLHIGGCTLYRHYRNMLSGADAYAYYINGFDSGLRVSLSQALLSDEWDVVTFQESSTRAGDEETYEPYLGSLLQYVRRHAPEAKLYFHETWTYAHRCTRFGKTRFAGREDMIPALRRAYDTVEDRYHFDGILPCFDAMCALYDAVGDLTYRDGFHCSLGLGRYLNALIWFKTLYRTDVSDNSFCDFDVPVDEEHVALAKGIATELVP